MEQRLEGLRGEMEEHVKARLKALMAQEAEGRSEATHKMHDSLKKKVLASHRGVEGALAAEVEARQAAEEKLRADVTAKVTDDSPMDQLYLSGVQKFVVGVHSQDLCGQGACQSWFCSMQPASDRPCHSHWNRLFGARYCLEASPLSPHRLPCPGLHVHGSSHLLRSNRIEVRCQPLWSFSGVGTNVCSVQVSP